jgi:hypothetical protein
MTQIATEVFYLTDGFNIENVNWNNLSTSQIKNIQTILHILSNDDLLNNLGTTAVGIALSLDAVKPYMPSNLNLGVYKDINWGNELKTIAILVENVYDLGDLSTLNYLDLDPEKVENLITNLSKLESINLLGHIATSFAIKTMVIGRKKNIKTCILNCLYIFIRSTELRISSVWFTRQSHFQISNCYISATYLFLYVLKTRRIIVRAPYLTGCINLSLVLHQISGKKQG